MAQIRFTELIKASGKPEAVSLWTDPRRNTQFMRAVKQNRVLTVIQEPGSKRKDFAEIGFRRVRHAAYLVFPKRLPAEPKARVIGIKYDLVDEPVPNDPVRVDSLPEKSARHRIKENEPAEQTFDILVRRMAVIETMIRSKGKDETQARERAIVQAKRETFDMTKAVIRNEIISE